MNKGFRVLALVAVMAAPASLRAQQPAQPAAPLPAVTVCGQQRQPLAEPPDGSSPVVLYIAPCFSAQGGTPLVDIETYLYYIQLKVSLPSQGVWIPYDSAAEQTIHDDFRRLLSTNFLDNLSVETAPDYIFPNGVIGKIVIYNMEERQRVKIVDYVGSKEIDQSKIDDKLKEEKVELRLDTFLDQATIRKVQNIVKGLMIEKGFQNAEVTPEIVPLEGSPKLVHLSFRVSEGPHVKIRRVVFTGNKAMSNSALKGHMKENREHNWLSFISGRGTYDETKFDEDAELVGDYYRDHGYISAVVGQPEVRVLEDSEDGKTRWIRTPHPGRRGPPLSGRRLQVRRQHRGPERCPGADVRHPLGRILRPEQDPQGVPEGA